MISKKFLIPVGAAVAALLPFQAQASLNQLTPQDFADGSLRTSLTVKPVVTDPIIQELTYLMQSEMHALVLRQSSAGALYAQHGSHMSHQSHHSHQSHRSGY